MDDLTELFPQLDAEETDLLCQMEADSHSDYLTWTETDSKAMTEQLRALAERGPAPSFEEIERQLAAAAKTAVGPKDRQTVKLARQTLKNIKRMHQITKPRRG